MFLLSSYPVLSKSVLYEFDVSHTQFVCFLTEERGKASKVLPGSSIKFNGNKKEFLEHLKNALYASKIISYAQGFMLLREAAKVIFKNI